MVDRWTIFLVIYFITLFAGFVDSTCLGKLKECWGQREEDSMNPFPGQCGMASFPMYPAHDRRKRIIGGQLAVRHSIPSIAGIHQSLNIFSRQKCGGALLQVTPKQDQSDIVVTAAHCVHWKAPKGLFKSIQVTLGAHVLDILYEHGRKKVGVATVIRHHLYNENVNVSASHDIAILKLKKPVKFTKYIQPICLPEPGEELEIGTEGIIAGWGDTDDTPYDEFVHLRRAIMPVQDPAECEYYYWRFSFSKFYDLCVGYLWGGPGTRVGDSGGPYFLQRNGKFTLYGIISYGPARDAEPGIPEVYVRVASYVNWIREHMLNMTSVKW